MIENESLYESRRLTNEELATIVSMWRENRGWTQETLAELAGITPRTVQRVEGGEPSSVDTRRALARALDWEDIDTFNKPWPMPNLDRLKAEQERIERETVPVSLVVIKKGRELREFAESATGWQHNQFGNLSIKAEKAFAHLQEYFQDYGDIKDCYSPTQKLEVNQDLQALIDELASEGVSVCAGTRKVRFCFKDDDKSGISAILVYVVAGPAGAVPLTIRVPRQTEAAW